MKVQVERVTRLRDADAAICRKCGHTVGAYWPQPYWTWQQSRALHIREDGHRMDLYRATLVAA